MKKSTRYIGLDVHADTIAVAVAESSGEVRSLGVIPNRSEAVAKLMKKLGPRESLRVCYEAGPTGYVLYWELTGLGIHCDVIAPTLIPSKPGDRVKTDRKDAEKLARCYRGGDLTAVWVPGPEMEALRDLVRARNAAKKDQRVARHRLDKFLLRNGLRRPQGITAWGDKHLAWVGALKLAQPAAQHVLVDYLAEVHHVNDRIHRLEVAIDEGIEQAPGNVRSVVAALQAMRGIAKVSAVTLVTELGQFSRFGHPHQLMAYSGAVPSEYSTGGPGKANRGGITKTGNSHIRHILVEAAWHYRSSPKVFGRLKKRQEGLPSEIIQIAWKAQLRLNARYRRLTGRGKAKQVVVTAIARELLGFLWAIACSVERNQAVVA
ncbi:MAG: IS110 family transposase [Candidatus Sericytochromatia bacterium]|nr:IS110 family transposase [Candidatus Tanganyikabacteria bacterium]